MAVLILQGSDNEKQQLQEILQVVSSVPVGQKLLTDLEDKGCPVVVCFNQDTEGWGGMFYGRENCVKISPPHPTEFYYGTPESVRRLSRTMVHELRHSLMKDLDGSTKHNSSDIKEYILADLLSEADAYLYQKDFWDELNGQEKMSQYARTQELQKALLGQNELALKYIKKDMAKYQRWIQEAKNHGVPSDEKSLHAAIMKSRPSPLKFRDGLDKWLNSTGVDLSPDDVLSLDIPLPMDSINPVIPPQRGGME